MTGFSTNVTIPRRIHARASSSCSCVGAAMMAPSGETRSRTSIGSWKNGTSCLAASAAAPESESQTAANWQASLAQR